MRRCGEWGSRSPDVGSCYTRHLRDLDVPETTFTDPDLTTFLGLDVLRLTAVGQLLTAERAVIECRMLIGFEDPFCKACGAQGVSRGTVARYLAHVPVGWRPTHLVVRLRRFACTHCRRVWRQDTSGLAEPRARLTRSAVEWGLRALALECMSVSRVTAALGELLAVRAGGSTSGPSCVTWGCRPPGRGRRSESPCRPRTWMSGRTCQAGLPPLTNLDVSGAGTFPRKREVPPPTSGRGPGLSILRLFWTAAPRRPWVTRWPTTCTPPWCARPLTWRSGDARSRRV